MKKKDTRSQMFEQVRAAKTYIGTVRNQEAAEDLELAAFMSIFHPDVKAEKVQDMIRSRRQK